MHGSFEVWIKEVSPIMILIIVSDTLLYYTLLRVSNFNNN